MTWPKAEKAACKDFAKQAMAYLVRNGLEGDPLRETADLPETKLHRTPDFS